MQTLIIQTVYFGAADRQAAVELGGELYDTLTRPRAERLAFGPGIPVIVGSSAEHVDLEAAGRLLIVPLLGERSFGDQATRERAVASITAWYHKLGAGHVVPVFTAPIWRNVEADLPGKPILGRSQPGGTASWTAVVVDVALAASRLLGDAEHRPRIVVLHAKADLGGPGGPGGPGGEDRLAERLARFIRDHTSGQDIFDITDLEPGRSLREQRAHAVGHGVFVAVHGDSYASRPWCERELLDAKRAGLPTLAVQVLRNGEQRSYPYSGNGPTVVWSPGASVESIVLRAIVEWLHARHFELDAQRFCEDVPSLIVLSRPPELLDLAQGPLLDRAATVIMYPDPEVSLAEREVLREARPRMRLVTPSTFYRGLELGTGSSRGVTAPLYGREIALSLSDSPDAGGSAGFTADHVADATVFLARALVSAGAAIAYGGDQRFGGYDELLAELIVAYNASGQARADYLISYVPATGNPDEPGAPPSHVACTVRSLLETPPYRDQAILPPPVGPPSLVDRAIYLSDARRVMAECCFARVALGGQSDPQDDGATSGYIGAYPGLVEEAWWTLRADRPLYIIGGFGGAAGILADLFEDRAVPAAMQLATFATAPHYSQFHRRASELERAALREAVGAPPNMAAMADGLRALARQRLGSDAGAVAWNGLTVAENRQLFRTRDRVAITQLVMRGLYRKSQASAEGKLCIEVVRGSILQVEAVDAIAIAVYPDVPIGGAAAAIDQVMSSRVSAALHDHQAVIPVPCAEIDADWLVIADLGKLVAGELGHLPDAIERCAARVAEVAMRNSFHKLAIVTFGSSAHPGLPEVVTRMVRGFAALRGTCTLQWFEHDLGVYDTLANILEGNVGVELSRRELAVGAPLASTAARDVLLTTRYADATLHATILPPDGAAVAFAVSTSLSEARLLALARPSDPFTPDDTLSDERGEATVTALLGTTGRDVLRTLRTHRLVIQHDVETAMLPFETFTVDGHRYSLAKGVIRRPALTDVPLATPRPVRRGALNLLLVIDPAGNLPGAILEAAAVEQAVTASNNVRVHKLVGHAASKPAVLARLQDPEIDVFHFCGHGFYDGPDPEQSGLQCANGERLTGKDVAAFDAMPRVAFFNACRSARFRDLVPEPVPVPVSTGAGAPLALASPTYTRAFAAYFLRGGIEAYVGTLWPVSDRASAAFAASIYTELSRGATLDAAVCIARRALREADQPDWANYILYGDGAFSIVQ